MDRRACINSACIAIQRHLPSNSSRSVTTATKTDISSFFPPIKSSPSSIARHMNGEAEPVSSLASCAALHSASDSVCGAGVDDDDCDAMISRISSSNWRPCKSSFFDGVTQTYQIVRQSIRAHDDNITLLYLYFVVLCVLHRLIAGIGPELKREIKLRKPTSAEPPTRTCGTYTVLHLFCPKDDLAVSDDDDRAVAEVGDAKLVIGQDGDETGRRAEDSLYRESAQKGKTPSNDTTHLCLDGIYTLFIPLLHNLHRIQHLDLLPLLSLPHLTPLLHLPLTEMHQEPREPPWIGITLTLDPNLFPSTFIAVETDYTLLSFPTGTGPASDAIRDAEGFRTDVVCVFADLHGRSAR